MADHSTIEWTDATWNPITGCSIVSPGCTNCYAMKLAGTRLAHIPSRAGLTTMSKAGPVWNGKVRFNEQWLDQPLRWKKPRRIFVCAHGDLFAEQVPDEWILDVLTVMAIASQHTFQVLTKRPERMSEFMNRADLLDDIYTNWYNFDGGAREVWSWPLHNVWLGVSAEDQIRYRNRRQYFSDTPAAVRFWSLEPMLGPIQLDIEHIKPDWIIVGGESGQDARPMHPDWVRSIRDQCAAADVPFFFKQWGAWTPGENCDLQTRTETGATWFDGRWLFQQVTPKASEEMHRDDEPDLWRIGKKRAGRHLDGVEHNGMPGI